MFIIYQVGRMSIIMYLPCMVLGSLTGVSVNVLIIVMGVIAIIYSYTGGLKSVLWTDFIQGSVLLIGVTFALVFLLAHIDVEDRLIHCKEFVLCCKCSKDCSKSAINMCQKEY